MNSFKSFIRYLISVIGSFLSLIIPKDQNLIIFTGSGSGFNENSRYLFNYFNQQGSFKTVWLTSSPLLLSKAVNKDLRFFNPRTMNGLLTCLRGKFIIGTGVTPFNYLGLMTYNTIKINLWHGVGPKSNNAGRETNDKDGKKRGLLTPRQLIKLINKWDFVNFPSKQMSAVVGKLQFLLPKKKRIVFGYPRCDHLFDKNFISKSIKEKKYIKTLIPNIDLDSDIILYAPTWRVDESNSIALCELIGDNLSALNQMLYQINKYLLISKHPMAIGSPDLTGLSNIMYLPNSVLFCMNDLLPEVASLITDYSSIATDYLIMGRPVAYYLPDYENNIYNIGLLDDLRANLPGLEINDYKELVNFIKNPLNVSKEIQKNIDHYLERYYDVSLHNSSKELYQFVTNINT